MHQKFVAKYSMNPSLFHILDMKKTGKRRMINETVTG